MSEENKQFIGKCIRCNEDIFRNVCLETRLCNKCMAYYAEIRIDKDMWNYVFDSQKEEPKQTKNPET